MGKYNYFDDDTENQSSGFNKARILSALEKAGDTAREISQKVVSGRTKDESSIAKKKAALIIVAVLVVVFVCFIAISFHIINGSNEKNDKFRKDAGNVCINYIKEFGVVRWESLDADKYGENQARLTGLCYARQMDFDGDGTDELMLCYNHNNAYYLEVWGYDNKKFVQLYSQEANSTDNVRDGVWVAFYYKGGKYYICKSQKESPDKVALYSLKGDKFKAISKNVKYDIETDIYYVSGKENTSDFETLKLSVFRKSKGDILVDQVTRNIDSFGNILSGAIIADKSEAELKAQAYYEIIKAKHDKYGKAAVKEENDVVYIDGLALVRLIDFDADGDDELLLSYRKEKTRRKYDSYSGEYIYYYEPVYSVDVYSWNGSTAQRIFSKDSTSSFFENSDVFYLLLKKGEKTTNICNNVYTFENSYCYTASSKVYRLKNDKFDTVYNAKLVNEYGYKRYYLDNESVYSSDFQRKGYSVPYFLNDNDTCDEKKYTAIFLSGERTDTYKSTVNDTVETIRQIYPEYSSALTDDTE